MYEVFEQLLQEFGVTTYQVAKATGISQSTLSSWKTRRNLLSGEKAKKIADYFGVTVDYLMTGKDSLPQNTSTLTARDKRDISKDLDRIMSEIRNGEDGPLYYNGAEIDEKSLVLLENAIEHALTETKKENKIKFNPHKNKK